MSTPRPECNCGSHKLAPLYHAPTCPQANDVQRGVAAPLEPSKLELGFMRSEIKMAIPRLRQDDIEWLIANFRSRAEAYAAAVSKNLTDKYVEMEKDAKEKP